MNSKYLNDLQAERYALVNKFWYGQRGHTLRILTNTKFNHLRKLLKYAIRAR